MRFKQDLLHVLCTVRSTVLQFLCSNPILGIGGLASARTCSVNDAAFTRALVCGFLGICSSVGWQHKRAYSSRPKPESHSSQLLVANWVQSALYWEHVQTKHFFVNMIQDMFKLVAMFSYVFHLCCSNSKCVYPAPEL